MLQIFKFVIVGLSNTCLSLGVYSAMMRVLPPLPIMAAFSQIASYSCGMVLSFLLNNFWVFRGRRQSTSTLTNFIVSQLGLMIISAVAMAIATQFFHTQPEIIWITVMTLVTAANFTILKKWVFKSA